MPLPFVFYSVEKCFGGTDLSEDKKVLRILSGIFLLVSFGFSIGTSAVTLVNTMKWWNGLNEENPAPVLHWA